MSAVQHLLRAAGTRPRLSPMRHDDVDAVLAIETASQPRPWSAALFRAELDQAGSDQPDRHYLTAWADAAPQPRLLGFGGVMLVLQDAHITTIAVDPAARRQQVGSHLLLGLLETALRAGATAATLEVRAGNTAAQRLYTGFGFAPVGVRPRYYTGTDGALEDAIIMWAHDLDVPAARDRLDRRRRDLGWPTRPGGDG